MSKKKNKNQKMADAASFSEKELNIISIFGVFFSGIGFLIQSWLGLIGGALIGIIIGVFFIRWYRTWTIGKNVNK